MSIETLKANFTNALAWNALMFGCQRFGTIACTLILYSQATASTFALWSSLNSVIYLILLWTDFGLRKSIARYMPEFIANSFSYHQWLAPALTLQTAAIIGAIPILIYTINITISSLYISKHIEFYYAACIALFITQAYTNCIRHIFHAQFKNKWFNTRTIAITTAEIIASCIVAYHNPPQIVAALMFIKVLGGILLSVIGMRELHKNIIHNNDHQTVTDKYDMKPFIRHSFIMWATTALKSLSERNAITLITMYIYGPIYANGIKIAQEGSLLLYRTIIKTIGSADTAFLSHAQNKDKACIDSAVTNITTKIVGLCVPLLGLVGVCFFQKISFIYEPYVFHTFIILSISYLIETMFMGYERMLEVKLDYMCLTIAYCTYAFLLACVYFYSIRSSIGSLMFITLIQIVRLVSVFIIFLYTRIKYHIRFPIKQAFHYSCACLLLIASLYTVSIHPSSRFIFSWITYMSYSLLS
jgi:hypothetical protein